MAPLIATISSLMPSKSRFQITARLTRKWEVKEAKDEKPLSLDMVLLDQQDNHIHTTIPKRLVSTYEEQLQEGRIYRLQHFEVAKNTRSYKPVKTNTNIIRCTPFTSIIEEQDQTLPIPQHKFEFHPLNKLDERCNKFDYLIDVVGLLTIVEDKKAVMTKNGPTTLRNIQIQDERECTAKITFWGDTSDVIDQRIARGKAQDKVIVVTSLRVVTFEGSYQLQSTFGAKLYIDLNIPEANNILERRQEPVQVEFINNNTRQEAEETIVTNRKTITQLLQMDITNEKEMFTCRGTISAIRTDIEWWYLSCTNCIAGIDDEGKCRQCKETISYPMQRYRLMTTLTDGIASAALILFGKEAEKVIGKPIEKMVAMYEEDDGKTKVYDAIQECIGKEYTFKVKVGISRYGKQRELKGQKILEPEHVEQNQESKQEDTPQTKGNTHQKDYSVPQGETLTMNTPEKKEKRKEVQECDTPQKGNNVPGTSMENKRFKKAEEKE